MGFTSNNADINDCRVVSDLAFSDLEVASLGVLDRLDGRLDHLDVDVVAVLARLHIGQLYDWGSLEEEKWTKSTCWLGLFDGGGVFFHFRDFYKIFGFFCFGSNLIREIVFRSKKIQNNLKFKTPKLQIPILIPGLCLDQKNQKKRMFFY